MTIQELRQTADREAEYFGAECEENTPYYLGFCFDNRTGEMRERQFSTESEAAAWLNGIRHGWNIAEAEWSNSPLDLALFECENGEALGIRIF